MMYLLIFLYSLAANFAHPVTPTFIKVLGLHDYMFGLAFACMSIANFGFSPFWGKMSGKYGGATVFSSCMLGYGVMQVLFGLSTAEWQICLARFGGGFFISGISVAQMIYIIKNSSNRGKDLAFAVTLNQVTSPFGFLIGGFLGDLNLVGTFIIQGISLALIGVLGFMICKDSITEQVKLDVKEMNPFQAFISSRDLVTAFVATFLTMVAIASFSSTCYEQCFNYYIKDVYGFPSSYNGILKACVGFIALFAYSAITKKLLKTNNFKTIIPVFAMLLMLLVGVCTIDMMIPFIIINVVFFGLNSVYLPLLQNMMTKYNKERNDDMVGLFNACRSLGMVFGSLGAGFIYEAGPKLSFVCAAIGFGICIILSTYHYKKSKTELI